MKKKIITLCISGICIVSLCGCLKKKQEEPKIETPYETRQEEPECYDNPFSPGTFNKPVIYLYGYDNEKVNVMLTFDGEVTSTYPVYDKDLGWNVTASKGGTLKDTNKRSYNYLFWEGIPNKTYQITEGFCIEGKETIEFLEKNLATLGLTNKEAEDFITYWAPKMQGNTYNVISFLGKEYTEKAKLKVTPRPEQSIRVFMAWYASDEMVEIEKQELKKPDKREGKTLVEWGGTELNAHSSASTSSSTAENIPQVSTENMPDPSSLRKDPVDMTLEENAVRQSELLNELAVLQNAAALKQQKANSSNGKYYVDKFGASTYFTLTEWQKLVNLWAYTGNPEMMISQYSIQELRNFLNTTP